MPAATTAAAVTARNASVRAKLSTALRSAQMKGAPRMPVRGPTSPPAQQPASVPVAAVIGRYGFSNPDPKSHAAKVTRLAALSFAGAMAGKSVSSSSSSASANLELTPALAAAMGPGGAAAVADELREFAAASLTGGFTWLVVRGDRLEEQAAAAAADEAGASSSSMSSPAVEVLNTPAHVSPLMLGYYPLACIDMTPEAYLVPPSAEVEEAGRAPATPTPPTWSRAARNKSVTFSPPAAFALPTPASDIAPSVRRAEHAAACVANLDWQFIGEQFEKARAWYLSDERRAKRQARQQALASRALGRAAPKSQAAVDVEEDATTIAAAAAMGTDEVASPPSSEELPSAASSSSASAESSDVVPPADPAVMAEATTGVAAEADAQAARDVAAEEDAALMSAEPRPMPEGPGETLQDGSVLFHLPDGSQEFVREDGTRAVVRPDQQTEEYSANGVLQSYVKADGTQVWPYHDETQDIRRTIISPDGTTTYEYRGGMAIVKYPDGRSKTVYSDGQEVWEPAA
eukprot:CAMPEP_0174831792 /NCGR_PEP_ID=MMETSP1114-20130205/3307_1 /TAXON_ID=312471 /ORGANISM="Neobodo designis, Strain CCAP 1951/1" /LENGTH=517 /DNA_ID=CAMNT_0016065635 /DNA_START=43 /DNA_END=1596 /DNA_ORIENTATION=+